MFYIAYNTPESMKEEEQDLLSMIEKMKDSFRKRVNTEVERLREEEKKRLAEREWDYSIKELEDGWKILYKSAKVPIEGRDDNESWSKPYKIINDVLFHADFYYDNRHNMEATKRIPQGLLNHTIHYQDW